jgi:hypothetical protein
MHLQNFTDADGLIWVYDRKKRFDPRRDTPRNVANEKFLYAPGSGAPDPTSDEFENWLADHIDGPASAAIGKMLDTKRPELDRSARSKLAAYIATQDLRTPKVRDFLLAKFQEGLDREWPSVVKAALEALGEDASAESVAQVASQYEASVNKTIWLDFFSEQVNKAGERLYKMPWCVLEAPEGTSFAVNDVGVLKCSRGFGNLMPHMPGWWGPITDWIAPLSRTIALGISQERGYAHGILQRDWMTRANKRLVLDASEFVFSSEPRPEIDGWWNLSA